MRVVIASVDYADFLAVTLPAWKEALPAANITVATAPHDSATQALAAQLGVHIHVTNAWYSNGHLFDKGAALDEAFCLTPDSRLPPPNKGERCLSLDADIIPFGRFPEERLAPATIYGCARYLCESSAVLAAHRAGTITRRSLPLMCARYRGNDAPEVIHQARKRDVVHSARACLGFFQLWRYGGQRFGSFKTAGKYDIVFRDSFAARVALQDFYVLHLGAPSRRNWRGRTIGRWDAHA